MILPSNADISYANQEKDNNGGDIKTKFETDRHPISSIPVSLVSMYKTTYNYEMNDTEFIDAIWRSLNASPTFGKVVTRYHLADHNPWKPIVNQTPFPSKTIEICYQKFIKKLQSKLRDSPYFCLPSDNKEIHPYVQVVHDRLVSSSWLESYLLLTIECIFYRSAKFHGKHMELLVFFPKPSVKPRISYLVGVEIKGAVFEDLIGLYPIIPTDQLQTNYSPVV